MHSKNKRPMTKSEREHVGRVKKLPCAITGQSGPSEAHEMVQGLWWLSIPLSYDAHRGPMGIHGDKTLWRIHKMDELKALNETLAKLYGGA